MREKRNVVDINFNSEFDRLLINSPVFEKFKTEGEMIISLFPYIFQDIFYALFLDVPKLFPLNGISTGARFNRLIIELLMNSGDYKRVRKYTKRNLLSSGMLAMYFAEF